MQAVLKPALIAGAVVVLLALPLTTAWNLAVAPSNPKLELKIGPKLGGVTRPAPLDWSWKALTDGSLQKAITSRVTEALPVRPLLVRLNNELRYELFGELTAPGVIRGAQGQLIEESYLKEYCARTEGMAKPRAEAIIPKLRDIQSYYRSRGKVFVYVITPSKVAHMPEYFVNRVPCPSTPAARTQFIPQYTALLRDAGIIVVDTASLVHSLKRAYDIELFPQGGVHWNDIAGARAASLIADEINKEAGRILAPPFTFSYTISGVTSGVDRDLADLLNVFFPPLAYLTPKVTFKPSVDCATSPSRNLKVLAVGSSFTHLPAEILMRDNCMSQLSTYFYLRLGRFGGTPYRQLQADLPDSEIAKLRDVDILLLEENESFAGTARYVDALRELLAKAN